MQIRFNEKKRHNHVLNHKSYKKQHIVICYNLSNLKNRHDCQKVLKFVTVQVSFRLQ